MRIQIEQLKEVRRKHKNETIVFAGGVFDLIHLGHIEYLQKLKKHGDVLVIAISGNKRVKERKGAERPIQDENDRAEIIDAFKYVDYTVIAPDKKEDDIPPTMYILQNLLPDLFITIDERWKEFEENIDKLGIKLIVFFEADEKINSTSLIINKIISTKNPN